MKTVRRRKHSTRQPLSYGLLMLSLHSFVSAVAFEVSGVPVHRVSLRQNDESAPYCFAASSALDVISKPINFLATQVWPSSRVAACALEQEMKLYSTVCEFGCGPGLPALTAAKLGAKKVYATDLDEFCLELVEQASREQNLANVIHTLRLDLTVDPSVTNSIPKADLYVFSDVFESSLVAEGAAQVTRYIMLKYPNARIWVFAQSDRACREIYLDEMRKAMQDPTFDWKPLSQYDASTSAGNLFLCDLDETTVSYV